ncbi:MAG: extracellular solute-binding protein [Candidatus Gygaella obscura]|nr:extracellular solute-binding protein [Candidatus Gygaella obscura]
MGFNKRGVGFCCLVLLLAFVFIGNWGCVSNQITDSDSLIIWHWMTDREEAFNTLAIKYEELTGIKIQFDLFTPSDVYSQKIIASAQGKTLPDIFGILGKKRDAAAFVKADYVLDLTSYMNEDNDKWRSMIFDKALSLGEFKEGNVFKAAAGVYAVPIDLMNVQMVYNKNLFKKAGLNPNRPPQSWNQFIEYLKTLRANDIGGFASGWAETWLIDSFALNYAFNIMGEDKVMATIKGAASYNDSDWIKVFKLFEEIRDVDGLVSGVVTMDNKYAEQLFSNERAAFAYNGSWCINVYKGMNPDLEYAAMMPPPFTRKNPMVIWGSAGASFYINKKSPKAEKAVKFLKWLTEEDQQVFLIEKTVNLPSNKKCLTMIPKALSQFADDLNNITHPNIWPYEESPKVTEAFDKGIQSIIIGEKTAEQVAAEVDKVKQKVLAK